MRKIVLVSIIFILLLSVSAPIERAVFHTVDANFVPGIPFIRIISPANKTYNTDLIPLNISISTFFDFYGNLRIVEYSLDGKENVTISTEYQGLGEDYYSTVTGFAQLPALSEGTHTIAVYATYRFPDYGEYTTSDSKTVTFTIDFASPYITILSPRNSARYNTTDVPLIFTVDRSFSTLSYCLDSNANIFMEGNTTLTGLPVGLHKLVVYATNAEGATGISETVSFEIGEEFAPPSPSPSLTPSFSPEVKPTAAPAVTPTSTAPSEPLPLNLLAASVFTLIIVVLGLSFKKIRKKNRAASPSFTSKN
ncbi:MAG: hypothetical protein WHU54_02215 [Candidatus Bathyarchaeia archaeon]